MRRVRDSREEEFQVLEPADLELWFSRLVRAFGLWVLGGVVAGAFVLGVTITVLRHSIEEVAAEVVRVDTDGTQPGKKLVKEVDSLRWELRALPRRVVEEIRNERGIRK